MRSAGDEALSIIARAGFGARAVIYLIVGASAASAAFRSGQHPHGMTGALQDLAETRFGGIALLVLAAGLACLAGWLAVAGIARRGGSGGKFWLVRISMVGDAVVYAGFVVMVLGFVLGWRSGGDAAAQSWTAWLFAYFFGRALVGVVGVSVLVGGLGYIVWAWTADIEGRLELPAQQKRLTEPVSRCGLTGRGAAIALVGGYLLAAAIDADPSEAHGFGGVLETLRQTSYGGIALIMFALAFGASGFFDFLEALYRRIDLAQP
jgi:hypothetical protein